MWFQCQFNRLTILVCALLLELPRSSLQMPTRSRRTPLEGGYVSFSDRPRALKFTTSPPNLHNIKITTTQGQVQLTPETQSVKPLPTTIAPVRGSRVRHEWVTGHVKHNSFIPAHSHNVFVPAPTLLRPTVLATSQRYNFYDDDRYRSHFGGFGVGVDYGGQGAGHGYQVSI